VSWVAGVDGCRGGWFVVLRNLKTGAVHHRLAKRFAEVLAMPEAPRIIAVDMPIGIPDAAAAGGRAADRAARAALTGTGRAASVFSPPVRAALRAEGYAAADAANRASSPAGIGLSKQAYNIAPRIREVDAVIGPAEQDRVRESFPELAFAEMSRLHGRGAAGPPARERLDRESSGESGVTAAPTPAPADIPAATQTLPSKRTVAGLTARLDLLAAVGFADPLALGAHAGAGVRPDDVLDACACCWTAQRIFEGAARRLPEGEPPRDRRGLRMEIWY
jgi:predicted RNase H-like nuclease